MVAAPNWLSAIFGLPLPPFFYLWLIALLLAMLAVAYLLAARDPRRYSGNLRLAIGGRLAGAALVCSRNRRAALDLGWVGGQRLET